ncbi:hypothetical protein LRAMOSA06208 [Lichtheimia ramosa]|uniref:Queuine tRNA-ribosyltransferase accessory subunit 2 n=1 Tax=Lichtheimia ramosa TaxID=688394 RepID=A0A077X4Q8_9FUNG|nr:hypothetical protein LRAMOSA06208 [Lichtheimia ramosa]
MSRMRFFHLHSAENATSLRRGSVHFAQKNKTIQTPACLTYTLRGSVPHLVADNLKLLPVESVQVSLDHFVDKKEPPSFNYPHGLHKYLNMQDQLLFLDVRDPNKLAPTAANSDKFIAVDTNSGVQRLTAETWIKALNAYRPDWCASLADTVKAGEEIKPKRIIKAVDRTLRWLNESLPKAQELNIPVMAPVVGYNNEEERVRSAVATAEKDVQGFILNAFELKDDEIDKCFKSTIDHLPKDKPRLAYGLSTPEKILQGISNGIDLFDGSYAYQMTEKGRAITFKFGEAADVETKSEPEEKTLNLWKKDLSQTFEPIDPKCKCYSCSTPHTQAYIHHLLNAHEMLGPLLLMSHNVYQLEQFMASIRKSIEENRFEQDMEAFMKRYSHEVETNGKLEHQDEIDADSLGNHVSKKRQRLS